MKKTLTMLLVLSMFTSLFLSFANAEDTGNMLYMYVDSSKAIANDKECYIDEDNRAVTPIVENARTLVPVRFIAEKYSMNVTWDENSNTVTLKDDNYNIEFTIGSNTMTVNNETTPIDSENPNIVAKVINDRTLIPLRALCEAMGKQVFYDRGLIIISDSEIPYTADKDKTFLDGMITKLNDLPTVGSAENLTKIFGSISTPPMYYMRGDVVFDDADVSKAGGGSGSAMPAPAPAAAETNGLQNTQKSDYSQTNTQVEGVDEADVVKTDGEYIYQVNNQRIVIAKINPAEEMSVTKIISRDDEQFNPIEMYVDGNKLVVFANIYKYSEPVINDSADTKRSFMIPRNYGYNMLQCSVYNISDKSNPKLERTLEIEGNYISSRKIENIVYIVASKSIYNYSYGAQPVEKYKEALSYTDSVSGTTPIGISFDSVKYFPNSVDQSYLIVASIDVTKPDQKAEVQTMLGGGQNIYVSTQNLYVATGGYNNETNEAVTTVYKFSLNNGLITYLSKGTVDGNIINQFSMDEHNGYFRIATTTNGATLYNNLYILDDTMKPRGKIENIAPGEKIYSTRFVGNRGYMVTFKQIDPLFVLDLSNADNPTILGKLKIPGYSNYLHPIDENHILGFGKDTVDMQQYDQYGNPVESGFALYQGMKMALFDVTDVSNPIQKFVEVIGDRGTDSPLLQDHRALLYSPEKKLLAFPVTVYKAKDKQSYGQFEFSGAYVYNFDLENGFSLKGKISHMNQQDMLKAGDYPDYNKAIERILFVGDNLITTSKSRIEAHTIADVKFINGIDIGQ